MATSSNWTVKNTRSKFLKKMGKIGSADGAPNFLVMGEWDAEIQYQVQNKKPSQVAENP